MFNGKNFKSVWKLFFVWQDDKEENWLRDMSLLGWHFVGTSWLVKYHFVKEEPKDYHYKLDFSYTSDMDSYLDIFEQAGWEHVGKIFLWHYFRKEAKENEITEIYTDNTSKIERNKSILRVLYLVLIINLAPQLMHLYHYFVYRNTIPAIANLNTIAIFILSYAVYRIKSKNKMLCEQE